MSNYTPNSSIVRRLMMKLDPHFFSYSPLEQDTVRQHFMQTQYALINEYLYQELFALKYDAESEDDKPLNNEQLHLLNAHTTAMTGIGDNSFTLNEFQGKEFDLTSFKTLEEYDRDAFEFQRKARSKESKNANKQESLPYRLYLNHNWVRFLDDENCFHYSTLSSLSFYLFDALDEEERLLIEALIPYKWAEGKNHEKEVDGGFLWDMKQDANGREAQLEALQDRARDYRHKRLDELNSQFHNDEDPAVYFLKDHDDLEGPRWDIVIKNAETAKRITIQHYLRDCEALLETNDQLERLKEDELEKLRRYINEAYKDICKNVNPNVQRLKPKRNVIISANTMKGLNDNNNGREE